jgi:hypothetical protein
VDSELIASVMAEVNAGRDDELPTLLGERFLHEHGAPPRIVWVPSRSTFGQPQQGVGTVVHRVLMTDLVDYEAHIWGESIDAARVLLHEVLRAGHRLGGRMHFKPSAATWKTEGEVEQHGAALVLYASFLLGVTDRPAATATTKTIAATLRARLEGEDGGSVDMTLPEGD